MRAPFNRVSFQTLDKITKDVAEYAICFDETLSDNLEWETGLTLYHDIDDYEYNEIQRKCFLAIIERVKKELISLDESNKKGNRHGG